MKNDETVFIGKKVIKKGWAVNCHGRITKIINDDLVEAKFDNGEIWECNLYELKDIYGNFLAFYGKDKEFQNWMNKYGHLPNNTEEYKEAKKSYKKEWELL